MQKKIRKKRKIDEDINKAKRERERNRRGET